MRPPSARTHRWRRAHASPARDPAGRCPSRSPYGELATRHSTMAAGRRKPVSKDSPSKGKPPKGKPPSERDPSDTLDVTSSQILSARDLVQPPAPPPRARAKRRSTTHSVGWYAAEGDD